VELEIQAKKYILLIESLTSLFSTIVQATQMHICSSYPPGAGTLQYNILEEYSRVSAAIWDVYHEVAVSYGTECVLIRSAYGLRAYSPIVEQ